MYVPFDRGTLVGVSEHIQCQHGKQNGTIKFRGNMLFYPEELYDGEQGELLQDTVCILIDTNYRLELQKSPMNV